MCDIFSSWMNEIPDFFSFSPRAYYPKTYHLQKQKQIRWTFYNWTYKTLFLTPIIHDFKTESCHDNRQYHIKQTIKTCQKTNVQHYWKADLKNSYFLPLQHITYMLYITAAHSQTNKQTAMYCMNHNKQREANKQTITPY